MKNSFWDNVHVFGEYVIEIPTAATIFPNISSPRGQERSYFIPDAKVIMAFGVLALSCGFHSLSSKEEKHDEQLTEEERESGIEDSCIPSVEKTYCDVNVAKLILEPAPLKPLVRMSVSSDRFPLLTPKQGQLQEKGFPDVTEKSGVEDPGLENSTAEVYANNDQLDEQHDLSMERPYPRVSASDGSQKVPAPQSVPPRPDVEPPQILKESLMAAGMDGGVSKPELRTTLPVVSPPELEETNSSHTISSSGVHLLTECASKQHKRLETQTQCKGPQEKSHRDSREDQDLPESQKFSAPFKESSTAQCLEYGSDPLNHNVEARNDLAVISSPSSEGGKDRLVEQGVSCSQSFHEDDENEYSSSGTSSKEHLHPCVERNLSAQNELDIKPLLDPSPDPQVDKERSALHLCPTPKDSQQDKRSEPHPFDSCPSSHQSPHAVGQEPELEADGKSGQPRRAVATRSLRLHRNEIKRIKKHDEVFGSARVLAKEKNELLRGESSADVTSNSNNEPEERRDVTPRRRKNRGRHPKRKKKSDYEE